MVGAIESTSTLVIATFVPLAFVAVRVYTVVKLGLTVVDPASVLVENDPGVMVIDAALATFHESVAEEPTPICEGGAVKEEMTGEPGAAVTESAQLVGAALMNG